MMRSEKDAIPLVAISISILLLIALAAFLIYAPSLGEGACQGGLSHDVCTVTLASMTLHSGTSASPSTPNATASFVFSLSNPGSTTYILSIAVTSERPNSSAILNWSATPSIRGLVIWYSCPDVVTSTYPGSGGSTFTACGGSYSSSAFDPRAELRGDNTTSFAFYPVTRDPPTRIMPNETYDYVIAYENGQSVSGSITAK
jgi:hypothetical protein